MPSDEEITARIAELIEKSMDMLDEDVSNVQKFWDAGVGQMNFSYNFD